MTAASSPPSVSVVRFRERFTTCASCRAAATGLVMLGDTRFATVCQRHAALWVRRANDAAPNSAEDATA